MAKIDDIGQLKKLKKYITKLETGGKVDAQDLKRLKLGDVYKKAWAEADTANAELVGTREEFRHYVKLVGAGDKAMRDYERSKNGENVVKARIAYEKALEHLEEILAGGYLTEYLDRVVSFDAEGYPSACEEGVPRMFNSTSKHYDGNNMHIGTWQKHVKQEDVKMQVLQDRLDELQGARQAIEEDAAVQARLDKFKKEKRTKY